MSRLVAVEFFKLRKRMMTWVLAGLLVGLVVLMYTILWSVSGQIGQFGPDDRFTGDDLRRALFLEASVPFSLQVVGTLGAVLAVILAAGAVGSEYAWGTVRIMATASSGRLRLIAAKLIVVWALIVAGAILGILVGVAYSSVITYVNGGTDFGFIDASWFWDQVQTFGRTLFVMSPYVMLAFAAATVGRSTLAGAGVGIGFAFVEQIITGLMRLGGEPWRSMPNYLIDANVDSVRLLNPVPQAARFGPPEEQIAAQGLHSPEVAALILAAYTLAFVVVAFAVYRWRDITASD
jgi:ABC-2 type transport system permease protein